MTLRCSFITSSYLRTSLRISKLRSSTVRWARSMALVTMLRLERHVVGEGLAHHPAHRAGGEEPHEVVFEREVEAALAGVALAPGAAAELVVDAAALVALGAEHVEPAELADLVAVARRTRRLNCSTSSANLSGDSLGRGALGEQLASGEAVGVAAEEDVDAAAGHVGGDGDAHRAGRPG